MGLMQFMILAGLGSILSWVALGAVVTRLDPLTGGVVVHGLFYTSLFLALLGTFTVIGFFARHWFERDGVLFRQVNVAARQSLIVSAAVTIAMSMQAQNWLNWWTGILLVILTLGVEAFFLAGQTRERVNFDSNERPSF